MCTKLATLLLIALLDLLDRRCGKNTHDMINDMLANVTTFCGRSCLLALPMLDSQAHGSQVEALCSRHRVRAKPVTIRSATRTARADPGAPVHVVSFAAPSSSKVDGPPTATEEEMEREEGRMRKPQIEGADKQATQDNHDTHIQRGVAGATRDTCNPRSPTRPNRRCPKVRPKPDRSEPWSSVAF